MTPDSAPTARGRYVILLHELPASADRATHFDVMLEVGESLLTWAMPSLPEDEPVTCEQLPPHRLAYLEYEGPVSGNRGHVTRWDEGTFAAQQMDDQVVEVELRGDRIAGRLSLRQEVDRLWTARLTLSK